MLGMRQVRSGDAEIAYEMRGEGPAVVLLHPFPLDHGFWAPVIPQLEHAYKVIAPDLRGHGRSGAGDGPATMRKHADDLRAVLRDAGVDSAAFVGVSIGGYVLFELLRSDRARVRTLVLSCTKATGEDGVGRDKRERNIEHVRRFGTSRFFDEMVQNMVSPTTAASRPDALRAMRAMADAITVERFEAIQRGMMERCDSVELLKTVEVPSLIIAGVDDNSASVADAELINAALPRSALLLLPEAGHYAFYERPQECGGALRRFLDANRGR